MSHFKWANPNWTSLVHWKKRRPTTNFQLSTMAMISLNQRLMFFSRIQYWERESATWLLSCKTEPFWAEKLTKTLGPGVGGWFNSLILSTMSSLPYQHCGANFWMQHQCQLTNCVIDAETCFLQNNSGLRIIREPPRVSKLTIREAGRNSFWCFQQCHLCQIKSSASLSTSLGSKWRKAQETLYHQV